MKKNLKKLTMVAVGITGASTAIAITKKQRSKRSNKSDIKQCFPNNNYRSIERNPYQKNSKGIYYQR